MPTSIHSTALRLAALPAAAALFILTACGGGGGDSPAPVAPPVAASLTLTGSAATGAALGLAAVSIKCVGASGTGTTAADGTFNVAITGASLPCVLSVTGGTTTLRSVAEAGTGTNAVANITPLSELIVARLAGGDAAALFTTFDAAAQAKLTAAGLGDARSAITAALKGVIDLTGVDPIKAPLVAASGGKEGNALDKQLDALGAALKSAGTTLPDLAAAVVANDKAPAGAQTLLKPAAATCAGLRSGNYRALNPRAATLALAATRVTLDVKALTYTAAGTPAKALKDEGACQFSMDAGASRLYVAKSGLAVLAAPDARQVLRAIVLVPEQDVPLAAVEGNWNVMFYGHESQDIATSGVGTSVHTINAKGEVTAGADCLGLAACVPWIPRPAADNWVADANGGYANGEGARLFPFVGANGQVVWFGIEVDAAGTGLIAVASRQQALALPTVGQVDKFWDASMTFAGLTAPVDTQMTVKTVDTTAQSYTRERAVDARVDGFTINQPRNGLRYRAAGSSQTPTGVKRFGANLVMPLPGMGFTVNGSADGSDSFGISITQP
ncbi:hypothetical protein CDN99_26615 [Roseateles aquatilis]|uniref:Uncharacterized protein n=1 Tax=Roseateles aquatilis TaxID=431061 RepID=A0A246ISL9_9BURK|nr:hypothetical protein [Roseateles aquatilis]OWQ83215.1 hypothetical protein CDN99_26615 [Roseateles aquatilis]